MKPIPILRHIAHESAGTLADALAQAGLEFRYLDLFDHILWRRTRSEVRAGADRDGRADECR